MCVQVGDVKVACTYDVERGLMDCKSGDSIAVIVRRNDQEKKLDLVLAGSERIPHPASTGDLVWAKLGLQFRMNPSEQVTRVNRQLHGGLEIVNVQADGAAARRAYGKRRPAWPGRHKSAIAFPQNVTYVLSHPQLPHLQSPVLLHPARRPGPPRQPQHHRVAPLEFRL